MLKKTLIISTSLALLPLLSPSSAFADKIVDCTGTQFSLLCNLTNTNFGATLGKVITFAFIGAVIIALLFLIYGGIKWITSGGDKTGVEEARNHVVAAIVGLIIVFLSYFIINIVVFLFTGKNLLQLELPTLTPGGP